MLLWGVEVYSMIVYHNILGKLASCGWTTTRLQRERQISNGTIIQIRAGKAITTTTIDTICRLCSCQPGDLISYVPDPEKERQE